MYHKIKTTSTTKEEFCGVLIKKESLCKREERQ